MSFKTEVIESAWHGKEMKVAGQKVTGRSAYELGLTVESQAKLLCPVNWGYLAASITTQAYDKGTDPTNPKSSMSPKGNPPDLSNWDMTIQAPSDPNEVLIGTPVEYGPHVEYGTIKMEAQPFLRPALDLAKGKTLEIVKKNAKFYFQPYLYEYNEYLKSRGVNPK